MEAHLPSAYAFALVLFRTAGLCAVAPIFGGRPVSARIRMALAFALSVPIYMGIGAPTHELPASILPLGLAALGETLIGLTGGLAARLTLEAATAAGHLAGLSMGLGYGAMVDPINGAESTALAQLLYLGALLFAVGLGLHRELVVFLTHSLRAIPVGTGSELGTLVMGASAHAVMMSSIAVRLALPIIAAATLGHLVLGIGGRFAPSLHLQSMGFSVSVLLGGAALYAIAPKIAELAARFALASFSQR